MYAKKAKMFEEDLPPGAIFGMSFSNKQLIERIKIGQNDNLVSIVKGQMNDDEIKNYINLMNTSDNLRLKLLVKDDNDKLWEKFKEATGSMPLGCLRLIKNIQLGLPDIDEKDLEVEVQDIIDLYSKVEFSKAIESLDDFRINLDVGYVVHFDKFLLSASKSYTWKKPFVLSSPSGWDLRHVVCEEVIYGDDVKNIFPVTNPIPISKPIADAMREVLNYYYLIELKLFIFCFEIL